MSSKSFSKSILAAGFGLLLLPLSALAQNVSIPQQQDPLEELVPIGLVLQLTEYCKLPAKDFPVITKFEKMSISLHDKYSEAKEKGKAKESFEKGRKMAKELQKDLKPGGENCMKVKNTADNMNEALKANLSILELIVQNEKKK